MKKKEYKRINKMLNKDNIEMSGKIQSLDSEIIKKQRIIDSFSQIRDDLQLELNANNNYLKKAEKELSRKEKIISDQSAIIDFLKAELGCGEKDINLRVSK